MNHTTRIIVLGSLVAAMGCGGTDGSKSEGPSGNAPATAAPEQARGELTIAVNTPTELRGSYALAGDVLQFRATQTGDRVTGVDVKLHGLTLDATLDIPNSSRHLDGFATATGEDTTMVEEDRLLIASFVKKLETTYSDITKWEGVARPFDETLNLWAQWVPEMSLKRTKFEDVEHLSMLCWNAQDSCGSYSGAVCGWRWTPVGHDCWTCSGSPSQGQSPYNNCGSSTQLGDHYSPTYAWNGSGWTSSVPSHGGYNSEVGDCFGRYGSGCGGGHGYNQESADHDHCVRNGHWVTSSWCSDELFSTGNGYDCY